MEKSEKPKGDWKKGLKRMFLVVGITSLVLLLLVLLGGSGTFDSGDPSSDIGITGWTVDSVDGGLNFTVNATNHGDVIGAATITCKLVTLSSNYSVDSTIELAPGKSDSYRIFLPLPEGVRLSQGIESVTVAAL
jgi:hypothetical protein